MDKLSDHLFRRRIRATIVMGVLALAITEVAMARRMTMEQPQLQPAPTADEMATYSWLQRNVFAMCMYCHVSVPGVSFVNYHETVKHVIPEQPLLSRLYIMVATKRMPKGRGGLPEEQIRAIHDWIGKGAKND